MLVVVPPIYIGGPPTTSTNERTGLLVSHYWDHQDEANRYFPALRCQETPAGTVAVLDRVCFRSPVLMFTIGWQMVLELQRHQLARINFPGMEKDGLATRSNWFRSSTVKSDVSYQEQRDSVSKPAGVLDFIAGQKDRFATACSPLYFHTYFFLLANAMQVVTVCPGYVGNLETLLNEVVLGDSLSVHLDGGPFDRTEPIPLSRGSLFADREISTFLVARQGEYLPPLVGFNTEDGSATGAGSGEIRQLMRMVRFPEREICQLENTESCPSRRLYGRFAFPELSFNLGFHYRRRRPRNLTKCDNAATVTRSLGLPNRDAIPRLGISAVKSPAHFIQMLDGGNAVIGIGIADKCPICHSRIETDKSPLIRINSRAAFVRKNCLHPCLQFARKFPHTTEFTKSLFDCLFGYATVEPCTRGLAVHSKVVSRKVHASIADELAGAESIVFWIVNPIGRLLGERLGAFRTLTQIPVKPANVFLDLIRARDQLKMARTADARQPREFPLSRVDTVKANPHPLAPTCEVFCQSRIGSWHSENKVDGVPAAISLFHFGIVCTQPDVSESDEFSGRERSPFFVGHPIDRLFSKILCSLVVPRNVLAEGVEVFADLRDSLNKLKSRHGFTISDV